MVYKVIGLMSGSSLDGLDIAYVHLQEKATSLKDTTKVWEYSFIHTDCYKYSAEWKERLAGATRLSAAEYMLLHVEYGAYLGSMVRRFVEENGLHYQVQLVVSHGHTVFHLPSRKMTSQLGDGAAIAAGCGINVVSDLRAMDLALGGQGAPIVPVGEQLLLSGYDLFLNLGGIANISRPGGAGSGVSSAGFVAFDVCPANRVLNGLVSSLGKEYDEGGVLAASGVVNESVLTALNGLAYYGLGYPKSLANEFGTEVVLPMLSGLSVEDGLRTYVEHIAAQVARAAGQLMSGKSGSDGLVAGGGADSAAGLAAGLERGKMLVTGGGAHNHFLIERLRALGVGVVVPETQLIDYKEALVMALIGVLRWREENNVFASVTGASRDSIGGAVWIGQEA